MSFKDINTEIGRRCRYRPASPMPKIGMLLLHHILYKARLLSYNSISPYLPVKLIIKIFHRIGTYKFPYSKEIILYPPIIKVFDIILQSRVYSIWNL